MGVIGKDNNGDIPPSVVVPHHRLPETGFGLQIDICERAGSSLEKRRGTSTIAAPLRSTQHDSFHRAPQVGRRLRLGAAAILDQAAPAASGLIRSRTWARSSPSNTGKAPSLMRAFVPAEAGRSTSPGEAKTDIP